MCMRVRECEHVCVCVRVCMAEAARENLRVAEKGRFQLRLFLGRVKWLAVRSLDKTLHVAGEPGLGLLLRSPLGKHLRGGSRTLI